VEQSRSSGGKNAKGGAAARRSFIPYRDSKLTRILKQSLGGNALTSILCTATAAPMHFEETISTLKFGQLCKTIKNKPKSNASIDDKVLLAQAVQKYNELKEQSENEKAELQQLLEDQALKLSAATPEDQMQIEKEALEKARNLHKAEKERADQAEFKVAQLMEHGQASGDERMKYNQSQERVLQLEEQLEEQHNRFEGLDELEQEVEEEKDHLRQQWEDMRLRMTQQDEQQDKLAKTLMALDEKESYLQQQVTTHRQLTKPPPTHELINLHHPPLPKSNQPAPPTTSGWRVELDESTLTLTLVLTHALALSVPRAAHSGRRMELDEGVPVAARAQATGMAHRSEEEGGAAGEHGGEH
jgi:hypothetical protein